MRLIVDALLSEASGTAERDAALTMLGRQAGRHRATLGADKAYDVADFVAALRALKVTPSWSTLAASSPTFMPCSGPWYVTALLPPSREFPGIFTLTETTRADGTLPSARAVP